MLPDIMALIMSAQLILAQAIMAVAAFMSGAAVAGMVVVVVAGILMVAEGADTTTAVEEPFFARLKIYPSVKAPRLSKKQGINGGLSHFKVRLRFA